MAVAQRERARRKWVDRMAASVLNAMADPAAKMVRRSTSILFEVVPEQDQG
jgi:hypothetical protein